MTVDSDAVAANEPLTLTPQGLHVPSANAWIDPWRGVSTAILTHAHADHARPGSGVYHAARTSEGLLRSRLGSDVDLRLHAYGEPFTLGGATFSLHPAGHVLGSAQVRVEVDGHVTVVTGDFKRAPDPSCEPFEVVPCDTLVTEATFALPVYRWPDPREVTADILRWWDANAAAGRASVLLCYSLGKAQRVLAELARHTDRTVLLHPATDALTDVYRAAGIAMVPTAPIPDAPKRGALAGELIVAPPGIDGSKWLKRIGPYQTAFASGWMRVRGIRRRRSVDRGFVISDHADWPALLRTVEECGATRVLATHGRTDVLVRVLRERGLDAEALETAFGAEEGRA